MRPISLVDNLPNRVLDGLETQTRRPVTSRRTKLHSTETVQRWLSIAAEDGSPIEVVDGWLCVIESGHTLRIERNPFGQPGDRLWMREPAILEVAPWSTMECKVRYKADDALSDWIKWPSRLKPVSAGRGLPNGCFREASRATLIVKRVWVERVQDISEEDCESEGLTQWVDSLAANHPKKHLQFYGIAEGRGLDSQYFMMPWFSALWDSIYAKRGMGWEVNPWVWCTEWEVEQ